jgi:hypothetical protein
VSTFTAFFYFLFFLSNCPADDVFEELVYGICEPVFLELFTLFLLVAGTLILGRKRVLVRKKRKILKKKHIFPIFLLTFEC